MIWPLLTSCATSHHAPLTCSAPGLLCVSLNHQASSCLCSHCFLCVGCSPPTPTCTTPSNPDLMWLAPPVFQLMAEKPHPRGGHPQLLFLKKLFGCSIPITSLFPCGELISIGAFYIFNCLLVYSLTLTKILPTPCPAKLCLKEK